MQVGPYEVSLHNHGNFRLDGGAMFGSVPKNLWSRVIRPDEENCIPLATRCMLLRSSEHCILVDCGNGSKGSEKFNKIFNIHNTPLGDLGYNHSEITHLLLTHLHFDHAGGISQRNDAGEIEACYPQAKVILQKENLDNAKNPSVRERASYLEENYSFVEKQESQLVAGTTECLPGIRVHQVNGHTRGQQYVEVFSDDTTILYPTDLIPTSHHLPLPYSMGYDVCAETVLAEKKNFLDYAVEKDAIIVFEHDPHVAAAKIQVNERGYHEVSEQIDIPCFGL